MRLEPGATAREVLEGEEGMGKVCDGAGSDARHVHKERGGEGGVGGGSFVTKPAEGRDLHETCLVGPPAAQTRGF